MQNLENMKRQLEKIQAENAALRAKNEQLENKQLKKISRAALKGYKVKYDKNMEKLIQEKNVLEKKLNQKLSEPKPNFKTPIFDDEEIVGDI